MEATLTDLPLENEREIPELSVENPCVIEDIFKDKKEEVGAEEVGAEEVELIYKPPRFFRRSLIHNALKVFDKGDKEKKPKHKRPLRQK